MRDARFSGSLFTSVLDEELSMVDPTVSANSTEVIELSVVVDSEAAEAVSEFILVKAIRRR